MKERERGTASALSAIVDRSRQTFRLVVVLAPRELRVRYRQSVLDIAWALISPIAVLVVYGLVLTDSFGVHGTCGPYLSSAWTGVALWTFFATALGSSVYSLIASAGLVTKVYFPREAVPLASVGSALADLGIGVLTVFIVLLVQRVSLGLPAVAFVLPVLVLVVWTAAVSVFAAVIAAFVRDIPHLVQVALRVGFFGTPVMYEAGFLPSQLAWTAKVNPVAVAITGVREALLCSTWPDFPLLAIHLLTGLALLLGAVLYTRSVESRITDVV
jgi:lipopolysaccharide transport system permease protein